MSVHDQILIGIILWIMAPALMVMILIAPLIGASLVERGRRVLEQGTEALRHTLFRLF